MSHTPCLLSQTAVLRCDGSHCPFASAEVRSSCPSSQLLLRAANCLGAGLVHAPKLDDALVCLTLHLICYTIKIAFAFPQHQTRKLTLAKWSDRGKLGSDWFITG
ncbi:Hypothetical predicted protein [Podarcis lilfordi]|uniref:Uncharacterized protein n=1 Tax=Podarcis lilfordi TaxID=74358 RepID=A0AA35KJH3_9SAUR|nr:Hypothetical predicted protein [Podarcis lilfordi]